MRVFPAFILLTVSLCASQQPVNKNIPANLTAQQASTKTNNKSFPTVPGDSPKAQPSSGTQTGNNQSPTNDSVNRIEVVPQADPWFKAYVIANIAIAIINLAVLVFIWLQRRVMTAQLGIMRDQHTAMGGQISEMRMTRVQTVREMKSSGDKTDQLIRQATTQANALTQQASAAEKAANAARMNAEAIIKSGRPWLLVADLRTPYLKPIEDNFMNPRATHCLFFAKNYGNTPAKIVAHRFELQIGDNPVRPPEGDRVFKISANPHFEAIIPPGPVPVPWEAQFFPDGFIRSEQLEDVTKQSKFLWLCGAVIYIDTFETEPRREYRSTFCYLYETRTNADSPFWALTGPPEYNEAT